MIAEDRGWVQTVHEGACLAEVGSEGDDLAVILLLQPLQDDGRVEAAGVREHGLVDVADCRAGGRAAASPRWPRSTCITTAMGPCWTEGGVGLPCSISMAAIQNPALNARNCLAPAAQHCFGVWGGCETHRERSM